MLTSAGRGRLEAEPALQGQAPAPDACASEAAGFAQNPGPRLRGCVKARTAELPRVRRAWMGPPLAALGLSSPRTIAAPIPNRCAQNAKLPNHALRAYRPGPCVPACVGSPPENRCSTTSGDGVAHEAPLSTVWRGFRLARAQREPHASTRARLENGAPVAQLPTSPSSK